MLRRSLVVPVVMSLVAVSAWAQQGPPPRVRREIPGFDFRKDGVWRRQARAVRAVRARLLSRRQFAALNAPMASGTRAPLSPSAPLASSAAVSGVLRVPALLFRFQDTQLAQTRTAAEYDQVLFSSTPSNDRPYTYRT